MNMSKYSLERTFFTHSKFNSRDVAHSNLTSDKIYKGLFEKDLYTLGYTDKELNYASDRGWVKRTYIKPEGKTIRTAYLWLEDELPQYNPIKRVIDRVYRFVTGQYSRYY